MKEKILFVYDSMMTGGTTAALLSLFGAIDSSRYDISLILYTNTGAHLSELPGNVRLLEPAYKETGFLSSGHKKILRTLCNGRVFPAIRSFLKYRNTPKGNLRHILMHYGMAAQVALSRLVEEQFDYAIGFMEGWANEYVASNKIHARKKFMWVHPQYKSCYLLPEIDRPIFAKADGIALIAEDCRGQFLEFFPEYDHKTKIVPNITSPQLLIQKAESEDVTVQKGRINFCTVCRCDIQVKGLDRLLKAFGELKQQGLTQGVLWHLIGGGGEFAKFKDQVEKLGLSDTIVLYGNQQNPLPYLRQMDAFVLASRYEGKPVSVTEAQILGLPCIVTNYQSAQSQVQHGVNGMVVNNDYHSIYEALKTVIQKPQLLQTWKTNALSGNYGNEEDIEEFYALLHEDDSQGEEAK